MRFKLYYNETAENDFVVIFDTYKQFRKPEVVDNTDKNIREGIRHFYDLDAIDDSRYPEGYVATMMEQLPKEDLSFKKVKEIE